MSDNCIYQILQTFLCIAYLPDNLSCKVLALQWVFECIKCRICVTLCLLHLSWPKKCFWVGIIWSLSPGVSFETDCLTQPATGISNLIFRMRQNNFFLQCGLLFTMLHVTPPFRVQWYLQKFWWNLDPWKKTLFLKTTYPGTLIQFPKPNKHYIELNWIKLTSDHLPLWANPFSFKLC